MELRPRFVAEARDDGPDPYVIWDELHQDELTTADTYAQAKRDAEVANLVVERDGR